MADGKSFAGWISGALLKRAQSRVDRDFGGNASKYVVHLVREDTRMQSPTFFDDGQGDKLRKLAGLAAAAGLDPLTVMRAALGAVVDHLEKTGGRISFPLMLHSPAVELREAELVWAHLDQQDRDILLEYAARGDGWPKVLYDMKQETAPRLHDLRLGYLFATSLPMPALRPENFPMAADDQGVYGAPPEPPPEADTLGTSPDSAAAITAESPQAPYGKTSASGRAAAKAAVTAAKDGSAKSASKAS